MERRTASVRVAVVNLNFSISVHHLLHCWSHYCLILTSGALIYKAYRNHKIPSESFATFVCYYAFFFYYCCQLAQQVPLREKSPKKHKLLLGIWMLLSALMLGFSFKLSYAAFSFFLAVMGTSWVVFHLYVCSYTEKLWKANGYEFC